MNKIAAALQQEREYLDKMSLALWHWTHQSRSHSPESQSKTGKGKTRNLRAIKITDNQTPQINADISYDDSMTFDLMTDSLPIDEGLGTEFDSVEQNFDPPTHTNNDHKQLPVLNHTQNGVDSNGQNYDHDNIKGSSNV